MEKAKQISLMMLMSLIALCSFTSCSGDNDDIISDPASKITGTYVGTGSLLYLGIPVESYLGMKFVITKSSNEYVLVTPRTADGEDFFGRPSVYQITQTARGGYSLRSDNSPNITLEISKSGSLTYTNPNVSVGGDSGYTLTFTGDKE